MLVAVGLLLAAPILLQSVSAAPTSVSAANTQLNWVASDPSGAEVTLDGSASSDDTVVFAWWENCPSLPCDGTQLVQNSPDAVIAQVTLPIGSHQINLWGSDEAGEAGEWIAAEPITVTVSAPAPVADAGADQSVNATSAAGADVALDGTGSANASSYSWAVNGTEVAAGATPTVTLPLGVNDVTLTVTGWDNETTATDTVVVTVNPVAGAGADQTLDATSADGAQVSLDGTGSFGESLTWSTADNSNLATGATPDPVTLPIGVNEVTLTATAPGGLSVSDSVVITVNPVADAGPDQEVNAVPGNGADVVLDGSGSIGDLSTIVWTDASDNEIATGVNPTVTLPLGVNEITMTISGPDGVSDSATVIVTVAVAPEANAGDDQTVKAETDQGATVTLDGSASTAAGDATIVSWKWSTANNPDLADGETAQAPLPIGTTTVTLTVTDSLGLTSTDTVDITVTVPAAHAGPDQTVPATRASGATVTLDGSASVGDIVTWKWSTEDDSDLATGETATVTLPIGEHEITLTVTDSENKTDTDAMTVTVTVPTGTATATLDPARGTVNSSVDYSIAYFPPDTDVQIAWIRTSGGTIDLDTVKTDAIGSATGTIRVPATPGGANQVRFTAGQTVVTADFEVAPRIKVVPGTVIPGETVDVSLRGFAKQENVRIRWSVNGRYIDLKTVTTSNTGSANVDVIVPATATAGPTSVRGDGTEFRAQTNAVDVVAPAGEPSASLTPTRGTVNTHADYTISNFPANATVSIAWERTSGSLIDLGTVQTDDSGVATGTIRIPATPGGDQQVHFTSGAITAAAAYDVAPRIKVLESGAVGDQVTVSLRGFGKNETVRIRWFANNQWLIVGTITTSNTGSANVTVTIPVGAEPGYDSVRGDGTQFRAQTNVALVTQ